MNRTETRNGTLRPEVDVTQGGGDFVRLFDAGRVTPRVDEASWSAGVLPDEMRAAWDDPTALARVLRLGLADGLAAQCIDGAHRLARLAQGDEETLWLAEEILHAAGRSARSLAVEEPSPVREAPPEPPPVNTARTSARLDGPLFARVLPEARVFLPEKRADAPLVAFFPFSLDRTMLGRVEPMHRALPLFIAESIYLHTTARTGAVLRIDDGAWPLFATEEPSFLEMLAEAPDAQQLVRGRIRSGPLGWIRIEVELWDVRDRRRRARLGEWVLRGFQFPARHLARRLRRWIEGPAEPRWFDPVPRRVGDDYLRVLDRIAADLLVNEGILRSREHGDVAALRDLACRAPGSKRVLLAAAAGALLTPPPTGAEAPPAREAAARRELALFLEGPWTPQREVGQALAERVAGRGRSPSA